MKYVLFALLLSLPMFGQAAPSPSTNAATNSGQFTISASAVSLGASTGTTAVADVGGTFAVTTNLSLRSDNIVGSPNQGYFGGFQYFLPAKKLLAKTNFDPATFQFYLTGSGGEVLANGLKHPGWLAGGGINYDPTHNGKFSVNLVEVRAARLPYVANGVTALVSAGVKLGF